MTDYRAMRPGITILQPSLLSKVVIAGALMASVCALDPATASDEESTDKQPSSSAASSATPEPSSKFNLQSERQDRTDSAVRGKAFKAFARSLMYPISPRTRENKRTDLSAATQATSLKGGTAAKSLAEFDLELIVDESNSMRRRDCPGGVSRWQWCGEELSELSHQLAPYVQNGFTLTTFSSDYEVLKNATAEDVNECFQTKSPAEVTTRLSIPLNNRFKYLFEKRRLSSKPVLMVVITDGVPHPEKEPGLVVDSIIEASTRINSQRELTVAFFQIGKENQEGKQFVKELDNDLVNRGARYDIVRSLPFEELERVGLVNALVEVVKDVALNTDKPGPEEVEPPPATKEKPNWFSRPVK